MINIQGEAAPALGMPPAETGAAAGRPAPEVVREFERAMAEAPDPMAARKAVDAGAAPLQERIGREAGLKAPAHQAHDAPKSAESLPRPETLIAQGGGHRAADAAPAREAPQSVETFAKHTGADKAPTSLPQTPVSSAATASDAAHAQVFRTDAPRTDAPVTADQSAATGRTPEAMPKNDMPQTTLQTNVQANAMPPQAGFTPEQGPEKPAAFAQAQTTQTTQTAQTVPTGDMRPLEGMTQPKGPAFAEAAPARQPEGSKGAEGFLRAEASREMPREADARRAGVHDLETGGLVERGGRGAEAAGRKADVRSDGADFIAAMFGRPDAPAAGQAWATGQTAQAAPAQAASMPDVQALESLVSRILVSTPERGGTEVRLTLSDPSLKGTEVSVIRDAGGALTVKISAGDPSAFQTLVSSRGELVSALETQEKLPVTVELSDRKDGRGEDDNPGRRSKGLDMLDEEA